MASQSFTKLSVEFIKGRSVSSEALAKLGYNLIHMHYVYSLLLSNKDIYVGYTKDFKSRLKKHQSGEVPYTSKFRPLDLIWYCAFQDKQKALEFEKKD